jgi:hypothetical protein
MEPELQRIVLNLQPGGGAGSNPTLYAHASGESETGGSGATIADLLLLPVTGTLSIGIGSPDQPARPLQLR